MSDALLLTAVLVIAAFTLLVSVLTWRGSRAQNFGEAAISSLLGTGLAPHMTALEAALRHENRVAREELRGILEAMQRAIETRLDTFGHQQNQLLGDARRDSASSFEALRKALGEDSERFAASQRGSLADTTAAMKTMAERLDTALAESRTTQTAGFEQVASRIGALTSDNHQSQERVRTVLSESLDKLAQANETKLEQMRATTEEKLQNTAERLDTALAESRTTQTAGFEQVASKIGALTSDNHQSQERVRTVLAESLDKLAQANETKLEQMRATVDEKLQSTLETRLGESFKLVSERLEHVHKGLGEMQALASGVGDLKRVLTNVRSRGTWGEVQLGMLLEDLLPTQLEKNVRIRPHSAEMVEFAIRLPGKSDQEPLFLPIDCKFPHEDYERLLAAQEAGAAEEVERAGSALERAVRLQARTICEKYVHPPHSTDFAIMYLPTEGLFAEVIRRPGLGADIQAAHRVMLTGPTTLVALLTSLQMGFRTLAIEKRSSEVWQILASAKAEFQKYGAVWDKLGKQLATAQKTVEDAGKRTRAVERQLRAVETLDAPADTALLAAPEADLADEEALLDMA